ncbi:MAG: energy-coupling factor transporter transmembrane component T [Anaerolineaceae bacterium]|nr:energy-coupling factor transporter transmembrane component T [Anaerolineaceae bacterium]
MMNLTQAATVSPLLKLDGRSKLVGLLTIFILAIVFAHPLYVVALLALVMTIWWIARLPFRMIRDILQFFMVIAIIILVVQVFFYPGKINLVRLSAPIGVIGFSGFLTLDGIEFGIAMVLRLFVIMVVAPLLVMTTPLPELMVALVKLKVPYRFAFIMTTALSLLPSIQTHSSIIQQAQLCRGVTDFESGKIWEKLRGTAGLLVPLILGTFRDSQTLDVAMSSRGFGAPTKRTFLLESHFSRSDYLVLGISFLLLAGGIYLRVIGLGVL